VKHRIWALVKDKCARVIPAPTDVSQWVESAMTAKVTIMMMRVRMTVLKRKEESADGDDDDDDDGGGEMMMTTTEMVETMQCLQCKSVTVDGGHSNRNRL
jgi:hypothetical protein